MPVVALQDDRDEAGLWHDLPTQLPEAGSYWMFSSVGQIGLASRSQTAGNGGNMLPAISADLPAYLLPPKSGGDGERPTAESSFGPAVRVQISANGSHAAEGQAPGTGLYGPDGQFVEAASQRESQQGSGGGTSNGGQPVLSSPAGSDASQTPRELDLADFDSIIPPAVREELRALADRASRDLQSNDMQPQEYKQLAELMIRVGRYHEAVQAWNRADEQTYAAEGEDPEAEGGQLQSAGLDRVDLRSVREEEAVAEEDRLVDSAAMERVSLEQEEAQESSLQELTA